MEYLVGVEHPCEFCQDEGDLIKVTSDVEGFGPGLLAAYPIQTVCVDAPHVAAFRYARQHGLANTLVIINLVDNSEEWWLRTNEMHKIDTDVPMYWEPAEEEL